MEASHVAFCAVPVGIIVTVVVGIGVAEDRGGIAVVAEVVRGGAAVERDEVISDVGGSMGTVLSPEVVTGELVSTAEVVGRPAAVVVDDVEAAVVVEEVLSEHAEPVQTHHGRVAHSPAVDNTEQRYVHAPLTNTH